MPSRRRRCGVAILSPAMEDVVIVNELHLPATQRHGDMHVFTARQVFHHGQRFKLKFCQARRAFMALRGPDILRHTKQEEAAIMLSEWRAHIIG